DRARPGADDPHTLAGDRHVVIPACAVEARPAELFEAVDAGIRGMVEDAGRGDDDVGRVGRSVPGLETPAPALERPAAHLRAVADAPIDAVAARDVLEVRPYLRARREAMGPLRVEREGVAVEVRRHVAGETGVRVLPPRSPEPIGLLVEHDVVEAG